MRSFKTYRDNPTSDAGAKSWQRVCAVSLWGRYVIFYLLDQDWLQIVRVLHGARDVEAAFADPDLGKQP